MEAGPAAPLTEGPNGLAFLGRRLRQLRWQANDLTMQLGLGLAATKAMRTLRLVGTNLSTDPAFVAAVLGTDARALTVQATQSHELNTEAIQITVDSSIEAIELLQPVRLPYPEAFQKHGNARAENVRVYRGRAWERNTEKKQALIKKRKLERATGELPAKTKRSR
eukprot:TRINITY_DN2300_c0_g2_i1.p2 TRINITY_DN2300_c0_g2~~TRINITY_DN2300_c0_g2_i1.p2  ORF type:complete len:174 (+),score=24.98 TRINITY_DN2300_c0_g2_i1:27-524(+)